MDPEVLAHLAREFAPNLKVWKVADPMSAVRLALSHANPDDYISMYASTGTRQRT